MFPASHSTADRSRGPGSVHVVLTLAVALAAGVGTAHAPSAFAREAGRATASFSGLAATPAGAGRAGGGTRATGRIEGVVEISSTLVTRRPQFRIYASPGTGVVPAASPRDPAAEEARNVVISVEGDSTRLAGSAALLESHRHARIAQRDARFDPHVVAVVRGAVVEFPNEDDLFHNVFSLSSAAGSGGFDLGRYPRGASRSWTFPTAGTVQVFCHIHSDMSAIVLVLPNPFFALPDEHHHFVIDDVPEGEYDVVAWHERLRRPSRRHVRVVAGQTTVVNFDIPLTQPGGEAGR